MNKHNLNATSPNQVWVADENTLLARADVAHVAFHADVYAMNSWMKSVNTLNDRGPEFQRT